MNNQFRFPVFIDIIGDYLPNIFNYGIKLQEHSGGGNERNPYLAQQTSTRILTHHYASVSFFVVLLKYTI